MIKNDAEELRELAGRLLTMAETRRDAKPNDSGSYLITDRAEPLADSALAEVAKRELKRRQIRLNFLPPGMFAEGGWNMLLDLFVADYEKKRVSITSACIVSGLPTTTALRHIGVMIECDLVHRSNNSADKRMVYLKLTVAGQQAMRSVLSAIA